MTASEPESLNDLRGFVAVAQARSFRKAAAGLGVSPSALSHTVRCLESRLGVRLLNRTTRSVSPTEAGERLLARLSPALSAIRDALDAVNEYRVSPTGTLRINAPRAACDWVLAPLIERFLALHPGMRAETSPRELDQHQCIRLRFPDGVFYRWEFAHEDSRIEVQVNGALALGDMRLMVGAAEQGLGLAFVLQQYAQESLNAGRLVSVLDDWRPPETGFYLYYPSHRLVPTGLKAFIDMVRDVADTGRRDSDRSD